MSSYRAQEGRQPTDNMRPAPYQGRNDRDDRFYDDHRSRSRSRDRRFNSPPRRSPLHDISRSPPRGPAAKNGRNDNHNGRDWDRSRDQPYNSRNRFSPSPPRGRVSYRDRDREGYRSPSYDSRSRSRSRGSREEVPRRFAAPPNKEIMMEGLATDMTEEDIKVELKQHYQIEGLTDVRVIRDRQTKQSRQFGFLRFSSMAQSQSFMERNTPLLYLYGNPNLNRDEPAKVRIVYSRERHETSNDGAEGDWVCKVCSVKNYATRMRCFRCQAFRADAPNRGTQKAINTGDNDASPENTPSQFLLLRGLEPSVTEELLVKGVAKMYKPSASNNSTNQPNKKGAKVASTTGDANLGAKEGTLRRVLLVRDRRTNESWRFGFAEFATVEDAMAALTRYNSFDKFTIASKPVLVSYVHSGVFVSVSNPGSVDPRFTFAPLINPSMSIAYWDEDAFVSEFKVSDDESQSTIAYSKKDDIIAAPESKETTKSKKRKAETTAMDISTAKKATPSYLQRWSNQHAELHGLEAKPLDTMPSSTTPTKADRNLPPSENSAAPLSQSYADPNKQCCYLCSRQFQTMSDVNKHERLSSLHQSNLQNEALLTKARAKLEKHGISIQAPPQHQEHSGAEYRDRAKERRKAFGVINKKGQLVKPSNPKPSAQQASLDHDPDVMEAPQSKGASLLEKMGYNPSTPGRSAPIQQDVYAAGVGLGAQGGKVGDAVVEAERRTRGGYGGFLEKTREGARERFGRL